LAQEGLSIPPHIDISEVGTVYDRATKFGVKGKRSL
jgi:hypothetical protein